MLENFLKDVSRRSMRVVGWTGINAWDAELLTLRFQDAAVIVMTLEGRRGYRTTGKVSRTDGQKL